MDRIIAGRFFTKSEADAVAVLISPYIDSTDICIFHNNPPGQHGVLAGGGDEFVDPGADGAGRESAGAAAASALTAGVIGAAIGGPVTALAAAATGAYAGSLAGALDGLGKHEELPAPRPGGIILSVRISDPVSESSVIDALRAEGAADIERAEGEWRDGDWVDFDPLSAPRLVEDAPH